LLCRYYLETRGFDLSVEVLDAQYLEFYVHCHPLQSVGHLHIHCCLKNLWTTNGRKLSNKNMPLVRVIEALNPASPNTSLLMRNLALKVAQKTGSHHSIPPASGFFSTEGDRGEGGDEGALMHLSEVLVEESLHIDIGDEELGVDLGDKS
jgi:hypothetical protein